jgi:hypothetical protein
MKVLLTKQKCTGWKTERKRSKKEKGDTLSLRVALFPKGMKLDQT